MIHLLAATPMKVNMVALNFVIGTAIPLLVALIARWSASAGVKAVLNLLLSAIAGALVTLAAAGGATDDVWTWVISIGTTWLMSIVSYYGLWRPTGAAPSIGQAVPGGIGTPRA